MFYFDDKIIPSPQIEASPLICSANQWIGSCMIETSIMKELKG